ncbi:erythrocyte membrane protein 1, PfEMP1, putative [Plasmodium gaboni]|nr:erythrocyte membrane protein 1, PfEMP1, putative [Plasmodium gaboni]
MSCDFHKTYKTSLDSLKEPCKNEGKERFKLGTEWNCVRRIRTGKDVCIPPRREHMCIDILKDIWSYNVPDSNALLKKIQEVAKHEGNDIVKELLKKYPCNERVICDAMKYSFADFADIIRGRDILKNNIEQKRIEARLKTIFNNIYNQLLETEKTKYLHDIDHRKLRSDWWDANRKEIWEAMTCNAPKNAYIYKTTTKDEGKIRTSVMQHYCAHNEDPPYDYDYIPQVLRWMTEWSENLCKALNEKKDAMKNSCVNCKETNSKCSDTSDGDRCTECQKNCKSYSDFVNKSKQQLYKQNKLYKELYDKTKTLGFNRDEDTRFVQEVKPLCSDPKSVGEYLDKASHCVHYRFNVNGMNEQAYVFKTKPKEYEKQCSCKITNHPLDKCPNNTKKELCDTFQLNNRCRKQNFNYDLDNWNSHNVQDFNGKNAGILIPPRRRHLCVSNINTNLTKIKNIDDFKNKIIESAFSEGYYLWNKFKLKDEHTLQAMKYSFADYGDIIKGTDMMDNSLLDQLRNTLDDVLNKNGSTVQPYGRAKWWDDNKNHIWNAMLCGYHKGINDPQTSRRSNRSHSQSQSSQPSSQTTNIPDNWCKLPDDDTTEQFLRWLVEWAKQACKEKIQLSKEVTTTCKYKINHYQTSSIGNIEDANCKSLFTNYINWYRKRNPEWKGLSKKYDKINNAINSATTKSSEETPEKYIKNKCVDCECNLNDLNEINKIFDDKELLKELMSIADYDSIDPNSIIKQISKISKINHTTVRKTKDFIIDMLTKGLTYSIFGAKIGIPTGIGVTKDVLNKLKDTLKTTNTHDSNQNNVEPSPPESSSPGTLTIPQNNEPFNTNILNTTVPVGIAFALGSIALLFYLKKKSKIPTTKLFRVLDIPQNDYGIPDKTSSNRYVPYSRYKGKTYLYVEEEETDDYIGNISSSDITSSSESEYDEIDINDIYPYKSAKYKTLIEVVLKPSTNNNVRDIHDDTTHTQSVKPSGISNNKLTDNEWNELKKDFISQYLQNIPKDLPNENIIDDHLSKDIKSNILPNNMDEKPFITQIQDRNLHGDSEIIYNIDWNIPKNITTNTLTHNNLYSGIDLINDSLNRDQHIDIYDELLKRKENEMFGTKHPKTSSTTNSVSTKKHNYSLKSPNIFIS